MSNSLFIRPDHWGGRAFEEWQQAHQDTKVAAAAAAPFSALPCLMLGKRTTYWCKLEMQQMTSHSAIGRWFRHQVELVSRIIHRALLLGRAATPIFLHRDYGCVDAWSLLASTATLTALRCCSVWLCAVFSSADGTSHQHHLFLNDALPVDRCDFCWCLLLGMSSIQRITFPKQVQKHLEIRYKQKVWPH